MKRDDLIFDIIEKEHQRQLKGIELIASENFVSDQVMQTMVHVLQISMQKVILVSVIMVVAKLWIRVNKLQSTG